MEEEVMCYVCSVQYECGIHEPVALPCGHSFCRLCVFNVETNHGLACPVCRTLHMISPRDLSCNFSLLGLSEKLKKDNAILPELCKIDGEPLRAWCRKCQVPVCIVCTIDHRQRKHYIVSGKVFIDKKKRLMQTKKTTIAGILESLKASSASSVEDYISSLLILLKNDEDIVNVESQLGRKCNNGLQNIGIETVLACEAEHNVLLALATNHARTCRVGGHNANSDDEQPVAGAMAENTGNGGESESLFAKSSPEYSPLWRPLRICVVYDDYFAQVSWEDNKILVSAFTAQFIEADFIIQWINLTKMLPARPEAFLEVSAGGRCIGKMYIRLRDHSRRAQHFMALCLGIFGPSYTGTVLDKNSFSNSEDYLIGGMYRGADGYWTKSSLMRDLEVSDGLYSRGVVATGESNLADSDSLFSVCTGKRDRLRIEGVVGEVVSDLEIIETAVLHHISGHVIITRSGLVIPTPTASSSNTLP